MEILYPVLFVFVAIVLYASVVVFWDFLKEVWRAYRSRHRSIATAAAITCIFASFPTVIGASLLEQQPPSIIQQALEIAGVVPMFGAGILGGIGLIWDRRLINQIERVSGKSDRSSGMTGSLP